MIAAINGTAVGIGATMTLPMDVRIAAESARFGFPFVRRGIMPEAASGWFLPRVVGISQAMEWVATGRIFDAAEALRGRLVSRVRPRRRAASHRAGAGRRDRREHLGVAVAATRQLLWSMLGADSPWDSHRAESRALMELGSGPDAAEGVCPSWRSAPRGSARASARARSPASPAGRCRPRTSDRWKAVPGWPVFAVEP